MLSNFKKYPQEKKICFCSETEPRNRQNHFEESLREGKLVKPRANGRNIVGQQLPTLLDVTCCIRLHTLLHVVGCCCVLLRKVWNRSNFSANNSQHFLCSVIAEAYRNNVGSVCTTLPTLLRPRTLITHGLQRLMGSILPTMHCRSQHCWELLYPFAHHYQDARNNSQHCWRNNVGGCRVRLRAALGTFRYFEIIKQLLDKSFVISG